MYSFAVRVVALSWRVQALSLLRTIVEVVRLSSTRTISLEVTSKGTRKLPQQEYSGIESCPYIFFCFTMT